MLITSANSRARFKPFRRALCRALGHNVSKTDRAPYLGLRCRICGTEWIEIPGQPRSTT